MLCVGDNCQFERTNGKFQLATIYIISDDSATVKWVCHDGVSIGRRQIKLKDLKKIERKPFNIIAWIIAFFLLLIIVYVLYDHYLIKHQVNNRIFLIIIFNYLFQEAEIVAKAHKEIECEPSVWDFFYSKEDR